MQSYSFRKITTFNVQSRSNLIFFFNIGSTIKLEML